MNLVLEAQWKILTIGKIIFKKKMCMKYICEIEKKQYVGWKVIDIEEKRNRITTPYEHVELAIGKLYLAKGKKEKGIYIFLNKIFAKNFLINHVTKIRKRKRGLLKVKIGKYVWKGESIQDNSEWKNQNNHFYTTERITPLEIEAID